MIEGWQYYPDAPCWESELTDEEIEEMEIAEWENKYESDKVEENGNNS
jgi:hypothetical protein